MLPFCDFMTIYQTHPQKLPLFTAGFRYDTNEDGELTFKKGKPKRHEGSFDTTINITCDGHTVYLSGNIGRFGRPDNLFGYSVEECIELASDLVQSLGYPRFTGGSQSSLVAARNSQLETVHQYTGARIARLDLTCNYIVKTSVINKIIRAWSSRKLNRQEFSTELDAHGVTFNYGSKRWNFKAYDATFDKKIHPENNPELSYLRLEKKIATKYLIDKGLEKVTAWQGTSKMSNIIDYIEFHKTANQLIHACQATQSPAEMLEGMTNKLRSYAKNYFDGHDLSQDLSRATFYRVKKQLMEYGIDISRPIDITRMPVQFEVIQISPSSMPLEFRRETTKNRRLIAANDDAIKIGASA